MGINFKSIHGVHGEVTIPSIGLSVGTMQSWDLRRHEDPSADSRLLWDLRAVFSFVNAFAMNSAYEKRITVTLGNPRSGRQYKLVPTSGRTVLEGRSLLIESVELVPI